jgi:Bacterial Ig-like domain (group 3)
VTFYNGATEIGAGTTTTGIATLTTSFSTAGKYTIKASYPGDAFHNASSGTVKQVVNKVKN